MIGSTPAIGSYRKQDRTALLALAVQTALFSEADAEALLGAVLDAFSSGALSEGHTVTVLRALPDDTPVGWTYAAPDAHAADVWNLWWIGVDPARHGQGTGQVLLREAEAVARARGARLVVIETSALPPLQRARNFYMRAGYALCGVIPEFYGAGDDKMIFAKRITQ